MPTERFFNLPEEKRVRIIRAAYEEMCRVPYDEISINKIIQKADIPRGSFYQYFENKDDLLEYMMEDFQNQLFMIIKDSLQEKKGDIFDAFFIVLDKTLEIGEQEHNCILLQNIFHGIKANHVHHMKLFQQRGANYTEKIYELADKSILKVNSCEDFAEIIYLLSTLLWNTCMEIFLDLSRKKELIEKTKTRIKIIKYGVKNEEV